MKDTFPDYIVQRAGGLSTKVRRLERRAVTKSAKINWVEGERRRKQAKTSLALDSLLSHMHARDANIRARFLFPTQMTHTRRGDDKK
jgi:hypothetical protein